MDGSEKRVKGPREFRHALSTIVNAIVSSGLRVLGLWESDKGDAASPPGSWRHFESVAPPWITLWARRGPADP